MRLLNVIFSGLAAVFTLIAGVIATAIVAITGVAIVLIAGMLGRRADRRLNRRQRAHAADVIEISATEISGPAAR